jgi:predicted transcriptional regulator
VKEDKKNGQAHTGDARGHQTTAKNKRSTSDTAQVYGISLSAPSTYLKTNESTEQQALQGGDILKQMIHGSNCGDVENELIHWLCHAQRNTTAMAGQMGNVKDDC